MISHSLLILLVLFLPTVPKMNKYLLQVICLGLVLCGCQALIADFVGVPISSSVQITSPTNNQVISGTVTLSVNSGALPADVHSIEYILNKRVLFTTDHEPVEPQQSPFSLQWNSGVILDGSGMQFQALARNSNGDPIYISQPVTVKIVNLNKGTASWVYPALGDTVTLNGQDLVAEISVSGLADPQYHAIWVIDGQTNIQWGTGNGKMPTSFFDEPLSNGWHEISYELYTLPAGASGDSQATPVVSASSVFYVDNGHTPARLSPNYRNMHLIPGEIAQLEFYIDYTDGTREQVDMSTVTLSYSNKVAVNIDDSGLVSAYFPGHIVVEATTSPALESVATVLIYVHSKKSFPHFGRDGSILTEYVPGLSFWSKSLLQCGSSSIVNDNLQEQFAAAKINTVEANAFRTPYYNPSPNLQDWKNVATAIWQQEISRAEDLDLSFILTGDDIARAGFLMNVVIGDSDPSWGPEAFQYALELQWNRSIAVMMVDEVNYFWGSTPFPTTNPPWPQIITDNGNSRADSWAILRRLIDQTSKHPSISFSTMGIADIVTNFNWQSNVSMAEVVSTYWDYLDPRGAYYYSYSTAQTIRDSRVQYIKQLPYFQNERPAIALSATYGPRYIKLATGSWYNPLNDKLTRPGVMPHAISAHWMYSAAENLAGIRGYFYMSPNDDFSGVPVGEQYGETQTATNPIYPGKRRWGAIAAASIVIDLIEPVLLQPQKHAIYLGPKIYTGARSGANGNVLIAVNSLEAPQQVQVDLSSYQTGSASNVLRYHVYGDEWKVVELSSNTVSDEVSFRPTESIVWVFGAPDTLPPLPDKIEYPAFAKEGSVTQCVYGIQVIDCNVPGWVITEVTLAQYGAPNGACPNLSVNPDCNYDITDTVTKACVGKSKCVVPQPQLDPCSGVVKSVAAVVTCSGPPVTDVITPNANGPNGNSPSASNGPASSPAQGPGGQFSGSQSFVRLWPVIIGLLAVHLFA